jgi:hypothetical protein
VSALAVCCLAVSASAAQQIPARRFAPPPGAGTASAIAVYHESIETQRSAVKRGRTAPLPPRDSVVRAHPAAMVAGGLIGGAAGLYLGGVFGANLNGSGLQSDTFGGADAWSDIGNAIVFGALGESLGMALGIHMANRGRGSFWRDALAVAGTGIVLLIPAATIDDAWVIIPVAQLWSGIVVERRTTR